MTEQQPAIGIEIELPWKVMLARVDERAADILARQKSFWSTEGEEREIVQAALDKLDAKYKAKVRAAYDAGITKGGDGYAEFAHRPRYSVEPLMHEVEYLYGADLLRIGETYPLHVTLGGFAMGRAAGQLLFGLEIVGAIRPERILQTRSWDRKGKAGALDRQPHELALGHTQGVEFRTLELYSPAQLRNVLRVGLVAATAIVEDKGWDKWQAVLEERARIKDIDLSQPWPSIKEDPSYWVHYASALEDTYWVRDSVTEIMDLID